MATKVIWLALVVLTTLAWHGEGPEDEGKCWKDGKTLYLPGTGVEAGCALTGTQCQSCPGSS